jgi:hypothetical protein
LSDRTQHEAHEMRAESLTKSIKMLKGFWTGRRIWRLRKNLG